MKMIEMQSLILLTRS